MSQLTRFGYKERAYKKQKKPPETEPHISSRESPSCSRVTRKRFLDKNEFGSDIGC